MYLYFLFIKFVGVTLVNKIIRFQVYNSTTHHLYTVLCVHHPKSSLHQKSQICLSSPELHLELQMSISNCLFHISTCMSNSMLQIELMVFSCKSSFTYCLFHEVATLCCLSLSWLLYFSPTPHRIHLESCSFYLQNIYNSTYASTDSILV